MTPEYINHLMGCKVCYAPAGRYCDAGKAHKLDSEAEFVLSLKTPEERRRLLDSMKAARPERDEALRALVKKKFNERLAARESA